MKTCSTTNCNNKVLARGLCGNCYKKAQRNNTLCSKPFHNPVSKQHPMYSVWTSMKTRCDNPNHSSYVDYGAKGIYYNPRWKDFAAFYEDMAESYAPGLQLDRINNEAPYTKINCRWATAAENAHNRSSTKLSERKVLLIRALLRAKRPCISLNQFNETIAPLFNIAASTVSNITANRQWQL